MSSEKKSEALETAEQNWYKAEKELQEAARRATAEFLLEGDTPRRRGWACRKLQTVAKDFTAVEDALHAVLRAEHLAKAALP